MAYAQCAEILRSYQSTGIVPAQTLKNKSAIEFLNWLGFLPRNQGIIPAYALENITSLLELAKNFSRIFHFPVPDSPGLYFFGGEISHSHFNLDAHKPDSASVGGCGFSPGAAFVSCIGEAAEYISFLEGNHDPRIVKKNYQKFETDRIFSKKVTRWLTSGLGSSDWEPVNQKNWVEYSQINTNRHIFLPAELTLRQPKLLGKIMRKAESSGCAAGPNVEAATYSALMEIIERDAVALWWYGGEEPRSISDTHTHKVHFNTLLKLAGKDDSRHYWAMDITTDLNIPAIACCSSMPDGSQVIGGFSANIDPKIAIEKAFLEMCQMELAQQFAKMKRKQSGDYNLTDLDKTWQQSENIHTTSNFKRFLPTTPSSMCLASQKKRHLNLP